MSSLEITVSLRGGGLGDGGHIAGVLERGVLGQQDLGEELSSLLEKSG